MKSLLILLLALGCGSDETAKKKKGGKKSAEAAADIDTTPIVAPGAPATPRPITTDTRSGAVAWRLLDHLGEGRYTFPTAGAPVGVDGTFDLGREWTNEGRRRGGWNAWSVPLPFDTNMPRPNYAPMGAKLYADGKEVAFSTRIAAPTTEPVASWYVDHGRIVMMAADDPKGWAEAPKLVVEELATQLRQRQLATSGLSPADFARTVHAYERTHRPGLYLPGGSTAEFTAAIPAKGALRFGMGLLDDPLSGAVKGDGVELRITLDGVELWKKHVEAKTGHTDMKVDLPAGAARSGVLRFESTAGKDTEGDYLVVTAPYLVNTDAGAPRRILVVGVDTLRHDTLSANGYTKPTTPELDQWLAQSVQFANAWSPAPRTKPSFRTAFTGRIPSQAGGSPTIAEVLGPAGFVTGGVVANIHLVPRFGFNDGMDSWEYENGAKATVQVDRALAFLEAHKEEDTYTFVHLMDPHTFYDAPEFWRTPFEKDLSRPANLRQQFNRWQIYSLMKKRRLSDDAKTWIRAQYDAEVAYTSHELSRLLAAVEKLPGDTLTVIHSDHGEEFWDHGAFEHNHSLYDELVRVELAIRPPGGWAGAPKVSDNVGLVDIAATIFDFAGVPADRRPPTNGTSLRPFVDPARAAEAPALSTALFARPLPLGHMRYNRDRWGVVFQKYKYILHTSAGNEELYDLVADPEEKNNLARDADATSLGQMRAALEKATGWPVRKGYRVRVGPAPEPTTFTFQAPILAASVMDPELNQDIRANLEWGETPVRLPAEVGTIVLSEDRKTVTFTPGSHPLGGTIFIQCEVDPCPDGTLVMGSVKTPVEPSRSAGGTLYAIEPGWVLVPTDSPDDVDTAHGVSQTETEQLESLGYLRSGDE
jgi:arylsulfatase A-like enzyme